MPGPREPTLRESAGWFVSTHWSVVLAARDEESPRATDALAQLCRSYWYPLYAYVRRRGHEPHDAQDLTQEFFARLLEKNILKAVQQERGKFTWFLLSAVKRFLANEWNREQATKRSGQFSLRGTIGEPNAGAASGGGFTLNGGFWPGIASTEPILRLRIELAGTDVIIAWPNPSNGFQLQEAGDSNGAATAWSLVSQSPAIVGSEKQVRLPATGFGRIFRLLKPAS